MPEDAPTVDQIHTYLLARGWQMGDSGSAAYLMVTMGHTVRMLHEPTEYDRDKAVFDIALVEDRHPANVRNDILAGGTATEEVSQTAVTATDVPTLIAFLRRRRLKLGLTQEQVAARIPGVDTSLLCAYETGRHKPSAVKLIAWADALGCDTTFTVRPAPPLRTRLDSLEELRQDMRDNAWARRVAAPGKPDDVEEIKRRIAEYETTKGSHE